LSEAGIQDYSRYGFFILDMGVVSFNEPYGVHTDFRQRISPEYVIGEMVYEDIG
jgi:hypothetical protein